MAENKGQQGTGRHPHKSTEEPWPHTKDEGAQHGKPHSSGGNDHHRSHSGGGSHGGSHGGGQEDNRSHGGGSQGRSHDQGRSHETQSRGQDHGREQEDDLKRREYRGADGEIHHHTRTYMEQHGGEGRSDNQSHGRDNNRDNNRSDRGR